MVASLHLSCSTRAARPTLLSKEQINYILSKKDCWKENQKPSIDEETGTIDWLYQHLEEVGAKYVLLLQKPLKQLLCETQNQLCNETKIGSNFLTAREVLRIWICCHCFQHWCHKRFHNGPKPNLKDSILQRYSRCWNELSIVQRHYWSFLIILWSWYDISKHPRIYSI